MLTYVTYTLKFVICNSSAHRKGAKDAEENFKKVKNLTEEVSSITKSQGFSEIFSIYFLKK